MLTWVRRLEICVGVANALSYIYYNKPRDFSIIHRNIDSETILLNDNWEPKLLGFKLSMKVTTSERHLSFYTDKVSNTLGYTDPTYLKIKSASHKSDIYSFGIVVFELLCGRNSVIADDMNKYLAPMAIFHYKEKILDDMIDQDLWNQMDPQSFNIFAETAYDCLNEERSQRPSINNLATRLKKALKFARVNKHDYLAHLKIPLESILSATNNFSEENPIYTSRFAKEYKGQLSWSGELISINARRINKEWKKGEHEFSMKISMLSSLKHKNLVFLVGFCDENDEKIIIIRHESRGSLKDYISDSTREKKLDDIIDPDLWKQIDPQSFNIFTDTSYDCLNKERSQRPNINEIVLRLEKALELQLK
ncbi:kinase-like domain, phloem protein 2-like protein [Tanacetum coccineum]|uniref:Kinase-like domain, phloem protein 2-like protein n=1 Tax=Tanacetum coccineum TaxID=301880 RepID=A0ABQ5HCF9_9ASTR